MDCSCTIDPSYDDGGPSFSNQKNCTARKPHRCNECRREIAPGELYERFTGMWDGKIDTYKTCTDCLSVREKMFPYGHVFMDLWSDVIEHIHETSTLPEDCLASLTPRAREKCCTILESLWDDIDYDMEDDE